MVVAVNEAGLVMMIGFFMVAILQAKALEFNTKIISLFT